MSAIVLAGGRSTRFGSDKAAAQLHGRTLLDWVTTAVSGVSSDVLVVGAFGSASGPGRIADRFDGLGPIGGIVTGLTAARHDVAVVVSCDAPLVRPQLLTLLATVAAEDSAAAVVLPEVGGHPQPLLAAYRIETCLPVLESGLASGQLRVMDAVRRLPTRPVREVELRTADPGLVSFRTCNTPDELVALASLVNSEKLPGA